MKLLSQHVTTEELFRLHHLSLRRYLIRMLRCEDAATEVAQESYLRLLRFTPRHPINNRVAYLFQVATNAARDYIAREQKRDKVIANEVLPETFRCSRPDAETTTLARERLRIVSEAVEELPPRCREVFLLSRLDGLLNPEIAERLGISRNMVEKHIIKALLHCRRRLNDNR